MSDYLSAHEVAELTQRLAHRFRITAPRAEELSIALQKKGNSPQYISDGYKQLWVENRYIAYSTIDDPSVYYAYVTDKHIFEEDQSYYNASNARKNKRDLPRDISDQFKFALQIMIEDNKNYVILDNID